MHVVIAVRAGRGVDRRTSTSASEIKEGAKLRNDGSHHKQGNQYNQKGAEETCESVFHLCGDPFHLALPGKHISCHISF